MEGIVFLVVCDVGLKGWCEAWVLHVFNICLTLISTLRPPTQTTQHIQQLRVHVLRHFVVLWQTGERVDQRARDARRRALVHAGDHWQHRCERRVTAHQGRALLRRAKVDVGRRWERRWCGARVVNRGEHVKAAVGQDGAHVG